MSGHDTNILKFKCKKCSLEFVVYTHYPEKWEGKTPICPECGNGDEDSKVNLGHDVSDKSMPELIYGSKNDSDFTKPFEKDEKKDFLHKISVSGWMGIILIAVLVTLFLKDTADRSYVEILQNEVENCVTSEWRSNDQVMECIKEAWSWSFDWKE